MKLPLSWVKDFVDLPTDDPYELAEILSGLGHEVESIDLLEPDFRGVVVARVSSIRPHPKADKVRLATVDFGDTELEVVCGAWNFDEGATVAYATVGSVLAGGFEVGKRDIRGVTSPGMIASERELGLSDDHEGILLLDDGLALGSDLLEHLPLPDAIFDLSITPNRPDAMSVLGIARDLAAKFDGPIRMPDVELAESQPAITATVEVEDTDGCRRFVVREVRNVDVRHSPLWMRYRLRAAGVRPINNLVDITNYVMIELGQPIHGFDLDLVKGESLRVHKAPAGSKLQTLDDIERDLSPNDIVISDAGGIVSLAGVMGGASSEMGDSTTRVLIEAATWDPPSILYTSKRHDLRSEASARFERGVDPSLPDLATMRVANLLQTHASGEVAAGKVDVYPDPVEPVTLTLDPAHIEKLLGFAIDEPTAADLLTRLHMEVDDGNPLSVTVPTFRPDIERPVDLIEEVARLHGYEHVPATVPFGVGGGLTPRQERERKMRSLLVGMGFTEANILSFMASDALETLALPSGDRRRSTIRVKNPLSAEEEVLRTTLLPGLLKALAYNRNHDAGPAALYEIGRVFFAEQSDQYEKLPAQPHHLAFVSTDSPLSMTLGSRVGVDARFATATIRRIAHLMGVGLELRQEPVAGYHPGRTARVLIDGRVVGVVGEVHPAVVKSYGLDGRVAAAELELSPLISEQSWWEFRTPSTFPPLSFDLAFELGAEVSAAGLIEVIGEAAGDSLELAAVFDEYDLGSGRKSLATRIDLRAVDRTLTDEEGGAVRRQIIEAVETELDGKLRGT